MQIQLIMIALLLATAGCTTLKPIELDEGQTYAEQIEVGDTVRLLLRDGRMRELRVLEVAEEQVSGKHTSGHIESARWSDVTYVTKVGISGLKTAGAGLAVAAAIPVIAFTQLIYTGQCSPVFC